jgi:hypothetical protein
MCRGAAPAAHRFRTGAAGYAGMAFFSWPSRSNRVVAPIVLVSLSVAEERIE